MQPSDIDPSINPDTGETASTLSPEMRALFERVQIELPILRALALTPEYRDYVIQKETDAIASL